MPTTVRLPVLQPKCPATFCPFFAAEGSPWTGAHFADCAYERCGWWHGGACDAGPGARSQIDEVIEKGRTLVIGSKVNFKRMKPKEKPPCEYETFCQWQIQAGGDLCPPRWAIVNGVDPRAAAY